MPELPEVETTRRGIAPFVTDQMITDVTIRQPSLRWPVPANLASQLIGKRVIAVKRRAKYLLLITETATLIIHLGMSGSLRIVEKKQPLKKHDHADIVFASGAILRFNDPRRFGAILWTGENVSGHKLLCHLGVEPLSKLFTGEWLYQHALNTKRAVKIFLMDSKVVVGVGNIYATEALYRAGIHPARPANEVTKQAYKKLTKAVKQVLERAIDCGGTTLKDFSGSDGKPGYFSIELAVYGRAGKPCVRCGTHLETMRLGQRASCFCPKCQPF
ncbi:MAG: bifunctional DNA-formamidopyrimidine glycosylase/DNA-(apurinic or apyrimidinic site) lyase [Endozoicomonadaceae bacterium]|nr:bifunctional DNA-formamidopyrimidine glycosylase/DNA-(apurinic or apyrimidinic site) lyase [Endozoicomonadaceae bacterium]